MRYDCWQQVKFKQCSEAFIKETVAEIPEGTSAICGYIQPSQLESVGWVYNGSVRGRQEQDSAAVFRETTAMSVRQLLRVWVIRVSLEWRQARPHQQIQARVVAARGNTQGPQGGRGAARSGPKKADWCGSAALWSGMLQKCGPQQLL